jgi:TolB-like protein/DNA-binding winged helix-turn-helix (wHTH) protein
MDHCQSFEMMLGSVRFDRDAGSLTDADGSILPLRPQSLAVLRILADNQGTAVPKDDLIADAWGPVNVTDDSLIQCIADIRRTIKDNDHAIVQTVPRVGYKLVAAPNAREGARAPSRFRLAVIAAVAGLVTVAVTLYAIGIFGGPAPPSRPSIAVLPFEHLSGDASQAYLSDGVSKAITTNLSRFEELFVISSFSADQYRSSELNARDIADTLGVRYLVSGDVQLDDEALLIRAQLADAIDGQVVWADVYPAARTDIIKVQNDLSARIATTLVERVEMETSQWARSMAPQDLTAYELALRSENPPISRDGLNGANALLDRAIALSPGMSYAYSLKAQNDLMLWRHSLADDLDGALAQARASAAQAIQLDNNSYRAFHVQSQIDLYADQDHAQSLANLTTALKINPNDADLMVRMATLLGFMNRDAEALEWIDKAVRQNPLHPVWYHWNAAFVFAVANEDERAIIASKKALAVYQSSASIRRILIAAHGHLGQWQEAQRYAEEILEAFPDFRLSTHMRNSPFMDTDERAEYWALFRQAGLPD